jgi:hypothetical protein
MPIQNNWQNYGCVLYFNLYIDRRLEDKDSGPNGSKHSLNLVCSLSLHARNFDLLVLFSNILTLPHLQRTCLLSLCYAFLLSSYNVYIHKVYITLIQMH